MKNLASLFSGQRQMNTKKGFLKNSLLILANYVFAVGWLVVASALSFSRHKLE
jgi:hypothetical protein